MWRSPDSKDVIEIAVLVAVGYAFWRRLVQKPVRLERNREALIVLSLIAAIMITDFLFDGFRFALLAGTAARDRARARFRLCRRGGRARSRGCRPRSLAAGYQLVVLGADGTVFAFLVILPVGEHFHIVTALPALFFGAATHANRVPTSIWTRSWQARLRRGQDRSAHRRAISSWKDALDAFTCTECGRCKDACPTFVTGKPLVDEMGDRQPEGCTCSSRAPRDRRRR